ncbi:DUF4386 family protein [Knoellia sp. CPCC 206450]|uniref:DUF4386 family protein n=1 Tax=Knoellia tibetensis TaxID=3404798 RepID=UPI003B4280D0
MNTTTQPTPRAQDSPTRDHRLLGRSALLGLVLFAVSIATFAPEQAPDPGNATAADVRRFSADNAGTLQMNTLAALASVLLLVMLVAVLAQQVRQVKPTSTGPGVMLTLAAIIAMQSMFTIAVASVFARPDQLAEAEDGAVATLYRLTAVSEWLYSLTLLVPCMALVGTYSWLALRSHLVARWVGWSGAVIATTGVFTLVGHVVPSLKVDTFVVPLFGWWLWPGLVGGTSALRWWKSRVRGTSEPVPNRTLSAR